MVLDSISQACFLIPAAQKNKAKKIDDLIQDNLYSSFNIRNGAEKATKERFKLFKRIMQDFDSEVSKFLNMINLEVYEKITDFIFENHNFDFGIPTGLLFSGFNNYDKQVLFQKLTENLNEKEKINFAVLNTVNNLKESIKNLVEQITNDIEKSCDMFSLNSWYLKENRGKLIIIISDYESCNTKTLQDLIQILHDYRTEIPILLLFGIGTFPESFHDSLPSTVSCKLVIHPFQIQKLSYSLDLFIKRYFIDNPWNLKLSYHSLHSIFTSVYTNNLSISYFFISLKYSLMRHLLNDESIFYSYYLNQSTDITPLLSDFHYDCLRGLQSFRIYAESNKQTIPDTMRSFINQDDYFYANLLKPAMKDLVEFHELLSFSLNLFLIIQSYSGSYRKSVKEIYLLYLSGDLCISTYYQNTLRMIKTLSPQDLKDFLSDALNHLKTGKKFKDQLVEMEKQLHSLLLNDDLPLLNAFIQETLKPFLTKTLASPKSVLFHEILYVDMDPTFQNALHAQPRLIVHNALHNCHDYLESCNCTTDDESGASANLPDTCILYKLYLECGRYVNLYDWFMSFYYIIEKEHSPENEKKAYARFIQSVNELDILGFINRTQRKTDHVIRTTFQQ